MHSECTKLAKRLLTCFVAVQAIKGAASLKDVPYHTAHLPDDDINIGNAARLYLAEREEDVGAHLNRDFFR